MKYIIVFLSIIIIPVVLFFILINLEKNVEIKNIIFGHAQKSENKKEKLQNIDDNKKNTINQKNFNKTIVESKIKEVKKEEKGEGLQTISEKNSEEINKKTLKEIEQKVKIEEEKLPKKPPTNKPIETPLVTNSYNKQQMQFIKKMGCVFDGLLVDRFNPDFNDSINMLKKTKCIYIHRAIETWSTPPDFENIKEKINRIKKETKKDFLYGFFIAESINRNKKYYDHYSDKKLKFKNMCSKNSKDFWGAGTCKPTIFSDEYILYLKSIIKDSIDLGITDFTFGQIYHQNPKGLSGLNILKSLIQEMKDYGKTRNLIITFGAQTNTIDDENYLKTFDYITGGVGQDENGNIEAGHPCWSYYKNLNGFCWALLWDKKYKNKANNILVYLDWNNDPTDDIHRFTRMSKEKRAKFLEYAYPFFKKQNIGFLFPLGEVLGPAGGNCHGKTKEFYSASNTYSCQDEDAINYTINHYN